MASSIILKNLKQLEKSLQKNINYIDFDYRGVCEEVKPENIVIEKGSPVLNAFKIWLQSKSTSYIRKAGYGGYLQEDIHHHPFCKESEEVIKSEIISLANREFPNVNIISLEVTCMAPKRYWKVKVAVQDKLTDLVSFDMYFMNNNIVIDSQ